MNKPTTRKPKYIKITERKCPKCGGDSFDLPYVEHAVERAAFVDGKLVPGEDGHDVSEHIVDFKRAFCRAWGCGQAVDLSNFADEYFE